MTNTKKTGKKSSRTLLTDLIQSLYFQKGYTNEEIPWSMLMSQVRSMEKDNKITDDTIRQTIKYMITFENIDVTDQDTLGLVPYYVDKCNKYIREYQKNLQLAKEFVFEDVTVNIAKSSCPIKINKKNETFD